MGRRWTKTEEKHLLDGVGAFGWSVLRRKCSSSDPKGPKRSKKAIQQKIYREYKGGGITRGSYSLREVEELTGYHRTQLRRAARALTQRWARTAKGGNYLISAEQVDDITDWLSTDYWCVRLELYGCERCGTRTQVHFRFGLCSRCYSFLKYRATKLGLPFSKTALQKHLLELRKQVSDFRRLDIVLARINSGKAPLFGDLLRIKQSGDSVETRPSH